MGEQSFDVRGIGLLSQRRLATATSRTSSSPSSKGVPVRVRDIAEVDVGHAPRLGIVGKDDQPDVVQGIVLMRYGGETPPTLEGIHKRVDYIKKNHTPPAGNGDQALLRPRHLVGLTIHTVHREPLDRAWCLVTLVLLFFLGNVRAALITALNIPLALLVAFMRAWWSRAPGQPDLARRGRLRDRRRLHGDHDGEHLPPPRCRTGSGRCEERIIARRREVGSPMGFSTLIIGVAFLPLFTMTGVAGVIFAPMAHTYAFAIGGAILLAMTLTPVLASRFCPPRSRRKRTSLMHFLHRLYDPLFDPALRRPEARRSRFALCRSSPASRSSRSSGASSCPSWRRATSGSARTLPMSSRWSSRPSYVGRMREILRGCPATKVACTTQNRKHPEVVTVVSQLGRPDDGTDVAGFYNIELFAPLQALRRVAARADQGEAHRQLNEELQDAFPGVVFNFSQYISDNVEEALPA